ncbi:MAG: response regulator [bacterium]
MNKLKILLVDDDRDILDVIGVLFELDGHSVWFAQNYNEALAIVEEEDFDLVLTDFRMPRMHGLYLLEMIKDVRPELPVVIMTAYMTEEMKRDARRKGAALLINKPFTYDEITRAIKKVIRRCQSRDGMKTQ